MTSVCRDQKTNLVGDAPAPEPWGDVFMKNTIRSGSGYGNGLRSTVLTTENTAVVAPMPSASAASAAKLNARCWPSMRSEYLRSCTKRSIEDPVARGEAEPMRL